MPKTPYEIRLDVLRLANEIASKDFNSKMEVFAEEVTTMRQQSDWSTVNHIRTNTPKMYSVDDIKKQASSLYEFVIDKNPKKGKHNE